MLMRPSTVAVAIVVALSAAAATTQVFADDEVATPVEIDFAKAVCVDRIAPTLRSETAAPFLQARN